jgi:hypothetical protein
MANFGQLPSYKKADLLAADDPSPAAAPQTASAGYAGNATNQLVQALRQFDANGNLVGTPSTAVPTLTATNSGNPARDIDGQQLAVGKG